MNNRGQFSLIAALLVSIILISTVMVTYNIILNNTIQVQPQVLTAIDETNFAIKQLLGFSVGYYGSVIQVTGDTSYANQSTLNYTSSGLEYVANTHPDWGAGFSLTNLTISTYWFNNTSYSTGYLDVTYNLTKLGIYGMQYAPSCGLTVQITNTTQGDQTSLTVSQDQGEPVTNLEAQNFQFFQYETNSTWVLIPPSAAPIAFTNGTYQIQPPAGIDANSYVVQVTDQRGIAVVASPFSSYVINMTWPSIGGGSASYNFTLPNSDWWNPAYSYRQLITITNNAAATVVSGYSVMATVNTASLVSEGKMRSDGSDLRIVNWNGSAWVELDRDVISMDSSSTQIWFKTQESIGSSLADNNYYLYYGDPSAANPPDNQSNVYLWIDDFNRADEPNITIEPAYTQTGGGTWSIVNETLENIGDPNHGDPCKLILNALGSLPCGVEMTIEMDVTQFGGGDYGRMGLSCDMDSSGSGYCALFHNVQSSLDFLNDLRSWGNNTGYSWSLNAWYNMEFEVINPATNEGMVKVWPVGSAEPSSWTIDGNFGRGQTRGYGMVGIAGSRQTDITFFDDLHIRYVVNPEPSVALGQEETPPGSPRPATQTQSQTQDSSILMEMLQNGTMQWLGQNLQLTTQAMPIPPLPVKSIHVNETVNGFDSEVPFQIEDWASNYLIPLGLTSNESVFNSENMIVFLANSNVSSVTIWWNGSDLATQTPYAYVDNYFKGDNPNVGILTNGLLSLQFQGDFQPLVSTVGSSSCTATFMRINGQGSVYGASPAYVITNGVVRDIVQQEAEWGGGVNNCPNIYSHIVITLPANSTYYTYELRVLFVPSQQGRTINDLCPIELQSSITQTQTENGISNSTPIVSTATGTFYNLTDIWQHHWSQFVSGNNGAGIMFTDTGNNELYGFDNIAGTQTGELRINQAAGTIELLPIEIAPVSFQYALNTIWWGAVSTFSNTTPIYQNTGQVSGFWTNVEYPPTATVYTGN